MRVSHPGRSSQRWDDGMFDGTNIVSEMCFVSAGVLPQFGIQRVLISGKEGGVCSLERMFHSRHSVFVHVVPCLPVTTAHS